MRAGFNLPILLLALTPSFCFAEAKPAPIATGLKLPTGLAIGNDGRFYVTQLGTLNKEDGSVVVLVDGKPQPFATGLENPDAIAAFQDWLFVAAKNRIWKIDKKGNKESHVAADAFPPDARLRKLVVDPETGLLYVLAQPSRNLYRVDPRTKKVTVVVEGKNWPKGSDVSGLAMDGASHLLVVTDGTKQLQRVKIADGSITPVAEGFGTSNGIVWDWFGHLFVHDVTNNRIHGLPPRAKAKPITVTKTIDAPIDLCMDHRGKRLLVVEALAGEVHALPAVIPGWEVDDSPLPLKAEIAFPNLKWEGWSPTDDAGRVTPLRPLVLTHAGDGSNRVFVATQQGVIHVFPNDQKATATKVFLDIFKNVRYSDNENEEGLLGLTFHPKFKENGEFFVFYTDKKARLQNVVSRFRVKKDNPNEADPASEEEIIRFKKPFWNHDGGTICFGPDGYLYVTHGDGGLANDPYNNGQKLSTWLGKILRIDVNTKNDGKAYGIPKDNPFVGQSDVLPEIYAYGFRNLWRMAFDRETGKLWAGEVGQNLYEEIVLVQKGGNYGWNLRESYHPFGKQGVGYRDDLIEPIWEYHHDLGKSITGGNVYRGKRVPELQGHYVYADYVSNKIWALKYDEQQKRVTVNRSIPEPNVPILSFGEDEEGDTYFLTYTPSGKGIYRFARK